MGKHFPSEFRVLITQPGVKKAFVSDVASQLPGDCPNCGGVGFLALFLATDGPFPTPSAPYRTDGKTSHFYDGKWWVGNSSSFPCPDCNGYGKIDLGRSVRYVSPSLPLQATDQLAKEWTDV